MRRGRAMAVVVVVACAAFLGACGSLSVTRQGTNVDMPVKAHKFLGIFACTSVDFPNPATHVLRGDTVTFKMTNDCDDDYEMGVLDNDKLFDSPSAHSVPVPKHTTASLVLTVSKNAEYGRHKSDIVFRNKNHDPKFEVDP